MTAVRSTWFTAVAALIASSATVHAQNASAEVLFNDGQRLMTEGKIAEACDAFEASNRIEPGAGTLLHLGECREQNGQLASAWAAFQDALGRAKDPKKQQLARDHVTAIEPKLSYLTISVSDESRIEGLAISRNTQPVESALWNRAIPVDGGTYVIAGHAPGHEEWSTTVTVPNESGKVSVEVPKFKELAKLVQPPSTATTTPTTDEITDHAADGPSLFTPKRKLALGVGAVGVAALAGGVVLGVQAKGFEHDAFGLCPDPGVACADGDRANALLDKANSRALIANISLGVGAAAVIGAGVLWFLGAPTTSESTVAVTPHGGRGSAGVDLTVRF